jgi:hypothetical protein
MARIIRPDSPARARTSLVAGIRAALADLDGAVNLDALGDRLAYAGLALRELERSTERTADAWERRGYWLKADQFRREWGWAGQGAEAILTPLLRDDLPAARAAASVLLPRLQPAPDASAPRISARHWAGALARLKTDQRAVHGP